MIIRSLDAQLKQLSCQILAGLSLLYVRNDIRRIQMNDSEEENESQFSVREKWPEKDKK